MTDETPQDRKPQESPEPAREPLEQDVIGELGDDRLQEIAGLLGTDAAGARTVVGTTVSALSGGLRDEADSDPETVRQAFAEAGEQERRGGGGGGGESGDRAGEGERAGAPLQGVAAFGGGLGNLAAGGLMGSILGKVSRPVANAVAKKTGIPAPTVSRVIELVIPVVVAVLGKRAAGRK
ncbi:DUF937 domain-containing protein [Streptomyces sp. NPDC091292]|uniref:DUF937 domain-containing protein n=1 Tax=Streptomyces sp. NPDC091292 TaxID=3365991 RepID=UPI0038021383